VVGGGHYEIGKVGSVGVMRMLDGGWLGVLSWSGDWWWEVTDMKKKRADRATVGREGQKEVRRSGLETVCCWSRGLKYL